MDCASVLGHTPGVWRLLAHPFSHHVESEGLNTIRSAHYRPASSTTFLHYATCEFGVRFKNWNRYKVRLEYIRGECLLGLPPKDVSTLPFRGDVRRVVDNESAFTIIECSIIFRVQSKRRSTRISLFLPLGSLLPPHTLALFEITSFVGGAQRPIELGQALHIQQHGQSRLRHVVELGSIP